MRRMSMYLVLPLILVLIIAGAFFAGRKSGTAPGTRTLTVGGHAFSVEVKDTVLGRAQGLSGRDALAKDTGMLFVFDAPGLYGFWMKDMKFPIDIVWIEHGTVVGLVQNAVPEPEKNILSLTVYRPPELISQVLELPAGTVLKYGLRAGDAVR